MYSLAAVHAQLTFNSHSNRPGSPRVPSSRPLPAVTGFIDVGQLSDSGFPSTVILLSRRGLEQFDVELVLTTLRRRISVIYQ
ncbi:hypothetical protein PsYK624_060460 [Phanerochaete sordida]|uniref:Uncharacterized protein n=1 Tax=Phanerochaete sordida TaxID=48140 RepID=A0A9P3G7W5_9APHY|nr:hypothetical protein PsYK624_060460 [Phanerochaete sordida]